MAGSGPKTYPNWRNSSLSCPHHRLRVKRSGWLEKREGPYIATTAVLPSLPAFSSKNMGASKTTLHEPKLFEHGIHVALKSKVNKKSAIFEAKKTTSIILITVILCPLHHQSLLLQRKVQSARFFAHLNIRISPCLCSWKNLQRT